MTEQERLEELNELREKVTSLESDMETVQQELRRPLLTKQQTIGVAGTFIGLVFAMGMWASSVQGSIKSSETTLAEIRAELRQLSEVAILKARIEVLNTEMDRLRDRLERQ